MGNRDRCRNIIKDYIATGLRSKIEYSYDLDSSVSDPAEIDPWVLMLMISINWTELFFLKNVLDMDTEMGPDWDAIKENLLLMIAIV